MKYTLILIACLAGCSQDVSPWQEAMRQGNSDLLASTKTVEATTSEAISILRENTTALSAIKTKVESLEASLSSPKPNSQEVIKSALESPPAKDANDSQPSTMIVAQPVGTRLTSDGTRLRWNVSGNWNPTILETSAHLEREHGINTDGMTHQQMADLHADLHDGKTGGQPPTGAMFPNYRTIAVTSSRPVIRSVSRGKSIYRGSNYSTQQSCPSGRCPQRR